MARIKLEVKQPFPMRKHCPGQEQAVHWQRRVAASWMSSVDVALASLLKNNERAQPREQRLNYLKAIGKALDDRDGGRKEKRMTPQIIVYRGDALVLLPVELQRTETGSAEQQKNQTSESLIPSGLS